MPDIIRSLKSLRGIETQTHVPLASYTTWKVGGPAEFLVQVNDVSSLVELLKIVRAEEMPLFVLGKGSNILVSDRGLQGITMRLGGEFTSVDVSGESLEAGGGAPLSSLVDRALNASLEGFEFAAGIPGTVGGAVITNAGAFSGSIADVTGEVETLTMDGKQERHTEIVNTYRSPLVSQREIVAFARFRLRRGSTDRIRNMMDSVKAKRRDTQPWGKATAGSVFKNPPGDSAGRMIEQCGLMGKSVGGATVSDTHANFIVNDRTASASDVTKLIDLIRSEVRARFGIDLELEIQLVGFDKE